MRISKIHVFLLILVLLFFIILFIPTPTAKEEKTQSQPQTEKENYPQLKEISQVDWGEEKAILAHIKLPDEKEKGPYSAKLILYLSKPNLEINLLKGKWAGANNYANFKKGLEQKASAFGFVFKELNIEDGIYPQNSIVIIPSGVWPATFSKEIKKYFGPESIVIYLGTAEDMSIDLDGKIIKGRVNKEIDGCTKPTETGIGLKNEEWPKIIHIRKTIDEIEDLNLFINNLYETILEEQKEKVSSKSVLLNASKNIVSPALNSTYAAILYYKEGRLNKTWINQIKKFDGKISTAKKSETGAISLQLSLKTFEGQNVTFYLRILDKNLEQKSIKKIASFDGSSPYWVGSLSSIKLPNSENIIIEVIDQYKREYAKALVQAPEYEIKLTSSRRDVREYCITKNKAALEKGLILVKKEGGEWTAVDIVNSCFAVSSKWNEGKNKLYFKIDEYEFVEEWEEEPSRWKAFVFIGIPFFILFIIWFLFFRRESGRVFYLEVPEQLNIEQQTIELKASQIIEFIKDVKTFDEVKKLIIEKIRKERGFVPTIESIENALGELVKKDKIRNFQDYYGTKNMKEEEFYYKIMLRTIEEFLKRNGLTLNQNLVDTKAKKWAIVVDKFELKDGQIPDFMVFLDEEKMNNYLKKLKQELNKESASLLLAINTKKTKLLTLEQLKRQEEYWWA
ncbi:MAG: hypothetical protein N3D10_00095 [Candidatus Micrarchaeota archaeon]|nr:hypothetical protein [Candidatus Micrarchaeota archaeon]